MALEKLNQCPVCGNESTVLHKECIDYSVSKENFALVQCTHCTFTYTNPRPDQTQIVKYYQSVDYISHTDTNKGLINKAYHTVRQRTLSGKLKLINKIQPKGTLLDIGCGTGAFLDVCRKDGWIVKGIEPDTGAKTIAQKRINAQIESDLLEAYSTENFDIITLWHVLEHVHELNKTIEKIKSLLNVNGKLIIAVPNVESYDAHYFQNKWAAYDVPRHLYHFSQKTLQQLMQKHGIKLVDIVPMKYDAYYISLISTKYKYNKINYQEAILTGIKSNFWAKSNNNNYSSLTYIFSK